MIINNTYNFYNKDYDISGITFIGWSICTGLFLLFIYGFIKNIRYKIEPNILINVNINQDKT
tara:strand:+ start:176 stop:361 length:186 start_codon:yes stop_codon:yes gene_type:complete